MYVKYLVHGHTVGKHLINGLCFIILIIWHMFDGTYTEGSFYRNLHSLSYENMGLFGGNGLYQLSGTISVIMKFRELE